MGEALGQPLLPQPFVLEVSAGADHAHCPGRGLIPRPLVLELLPLSFGLEDEVSDRVRLVDAHAVVVHLLLPRRQEDPFVTLLGCIGLPLQVEPDLLEAVQLRLVHADALQRLTGLRQPRVPLLCDRRVQLRRFSGARYGNRLYWQWLLGMLRHLTADLIDLSEHAFLLNLLRRSRQSVYGVGLGLHDLLML